MTESPSKEEAIRSIILEGVAGDYVDIANLVKDRYRIDVSVALVEQVAIQLREARKSIEEQASSQKDTATPEAVSAPVNSRELTLQYVEAVGGFTKARQAIDDLEQSLKKLM